MDLPEVSPDADAPTIGEDEYRVVLKRFGALPFNYYSQCFNPLVVPAEEPVTADLADDLADIWNDVKRGLILYESGAIEAAVWEWRFHFSAHWGHHACGSLYALQAWFSQNDDDLESSRSDGREPAAVSLDLQPASASEVVSRRG